MEKQQSKTRVEQGRNKPLIRFPEFNHALQHKRLNELLDDAKAKGIEMEEQKEMLHKWYADDKTAASQKELVAKMGAGV